MQSEKIVLHVDDDPSMLKLVSRILSAKGYKVFSVPDSAKAIPTLFETSARVVLLDIDMPGKDGLTILREIKQQDAGIQVIMVTGLVSIGTVLQATSLGAEGCVFKPILDHNKIVDAVDRAFIKIDGWWDALREWMERSNRLPETSTVRDRMKQRPAPSDKSVLELLEIS